MIFASPIAHSALCLCFEKSSNTAKNWKKTKKNLSIILLLKWPLLEPKMFTVLWDRSVGKNKIKIFPNCTFLDFKAIW